MKNILQIIVLLFISSFAYGQPTDARATLRTSNLTVKAFIMAETDVAFPNAQNALFINFAVSVPTNGQPLANAPAVISTSTITGLSVNGSSIPIQIINDRFVYTFLITGNVASQTSWAAFSENLALTVTFSEEADGRVPHLDNLINSGPWGQEYFYFQVNQSVRSDTEGDPFYSGIEGSYASSDVYVSATVALPVTLISFNAEKFQTRSSKLSWSTASEINSSHFLVQRSSDRKEWTTLGKVTAAGESQIIRNYELIDQNVYNGVDASLTAYYRLVMVDLDGQTKISPMESVVFGNNDIAKNRQFVAYPNPASEGIHVEWNADISDQPTVIEFFDTHGKQVYTHQVGENSSQEYVDFTRTTILSGLYFMRIMSGNEPLEFKQIVIGQR